MYGLRTAAAARASRKKRSRTTRDVMSSAARIFTATRLPWEMLAASYAAALPPRPVSGLRRSLRCRVVPIGTRELVEVAMRAARGHWIGACRRVALDWEL